MSAEQIKRLADEYAEAVTAARAYTLNPNVLNDNLSAEVRTKAALHAAIDAHTAEPPINAAAQEPRSPAGPQPQAEKVGEPDPLTKAPASAAPNEPVAPLPSTKAQFIDWLVSRRQELGGSISEHNHRRLLSERTVAELRQQYDRIVANEEAAERASPQAVPAEFPFSLASKELPVFWPEGFISRWRTMQANAPALQATAAAACFWYDAGRDDNRAALSQDEAGRPT
jgi:hypothetical protein